MKRATRNSVIAIAAASGAMAVAGPVHADSAAQGSAGGSPGLISGNGIQLPVHLPVNVCGNTVNVAGLLNPAMGNTCANKGGGTGGKERPAAPSGATAHARTQDSPGLVSGNGLQLPVDLPVNVSGNSVNVVGVGNPVFGNTSANVPGDHPQEPGRATPPKPQEPPVAPPVRSEPPRPQEPPATHPAPTPPVVRHEPPGSLAQTGAETTWAAAVASLASLMGGALLYRRSRTRQAGREA
ncbi:chaplin [Streptomyces olivaceoviridis]|uniref:Chaplin n=1 Tax=Streptomyces olivaceoviridis TaxID=1921 RepID=A0ABW7VGX3_STROI|nr:chaplin [Streptomyces corchorusii]